MITTCFGRGTALLLLLLALVSCSDDDAPLPGPGTVLRQWRFYEYLKKGPGSSLGDVKVGDDRFLVSGVASEQLELGQLVLVPPGEGPRAKLEVFSNETGLTYWTAAQAPFANLGSPAEVILGGSAELEQYQIFRKADANATLKMVITQANMEIMDGNPGPPLSLECNWNRDLIDCAEIMSAQLSLDAELVDITTGSQKWVTSAAATLSGFRQNWKFVADTDRLITRDEIWNNDSFDFDPDVDEDVGSHARARLHQSIAIDVPLNKIDKDDLFYLYVYSISDAFNHRQRESYVGARFRDPGGASGVSFETTGLEPVETAPPLPRLSPPAPAPACAAPDPAAGTIQFSASSYVAPEVPGLGARVTITRTGGSTGEVSAVLTTSDGTASANTDYKPIATVVRFGEGEMGERSVHVPVVNDGLEEADETVHLVLSEPMGCATLGTPSSSLLTIADDDHPLPVTMFLLGGTVNGLVGTGLTLRNSSGVETQPTGGPFSFPVPVPEATSYSVTVTTQPTNPTQICTVSNGSGTISGADVTSIVVDCVTPPSNGALDPTFGSGGRVSSALPGARAVALQSDGKLLVVGGMKLSRYSTDGSIDTSFGTAGVVTIVANGGPLDAMQALAVQADGKVVVAGFTSTAGQDDFAVLRYAANGTIDTSFGTGGKVVTDFSGSTDQAEAVLVQGDGKIVAAGQATFTPTTTPDADFAVVRYNADGSLDSGFGTGGMTHTSVAGRADFGRAVVVQGDEKIVVAGRVGADGGSNPDFGVVRYNANGTLDTSFGIPGTGIVRLDVTAGDWDEAADLVIQADGKLVVGGFAVTGGAFHFALIRLMGAGVVDTGFGTAGVVTTAFSANGDFGRAVALDASQRIVVVGQASNTLNGDFAIARYDGDGKLEPVFGTGGKVTVDFFGAIDGAMDLAIGADGKLVVAGSARNGGTTGLGIARVLP